MNRQADGWVGRSLADAMGGLALGDRKDRSLTVAARSEALGDSWKPLPYSRGSLGDEDAALPFDSGRGLALGSFT